MAGLVGRYGVVDPRDCARKRRIFTAPGAWYSCWKLRELELNSTVAQVKWGAHVPFPCPGSGDLQAAADGGTFSAGTFNSVETSTVGKAAEVPWRIRVGMYPGFGNQSTNVQDLGARVRTVASMYASSPALNVES
jgi:hypothetical protein